MKEKKDECSYTFFLYNAGRTGKNEGVLGMREACYENNETIMEYAHSMKKIGLLLEGQAVLYCCDEEGNQYMMDNLETDSVFGEPFLLPEESQHYYVCARGKTKVLFIDYEHVIKRCENACRFHSQLVSNLLQMIAARASQQASRILCAFQKQYQEKNQCISEFP